MTCHKWSARSGAGVDRRHGDWWLDGAPILIVSHLRTRVGAFHWLFHRARTQMDRGRPPVTVGNQTRSAFSETRTSRLSLGFVLQSLIGGFFYVGGRARHGSLLVSSTAPPAPKNIYERHILRSCQIKIHSPRLKPGTESSALFPSPPAIATRSFAHLAL